MTLYRLSRLFYVFRNIYVCKYTCIHTHICTYTKHRNTHTHTHTLVIYFCFWLSYFQILPVEHLSGKTFVASLWQLFFLPSFSLFLYSFTKWRYLILFCLWKTNSFVLEWVNCCWNAYVVFFFRGQRYHFSLTAGS